MTRSISFFQSGLLVMMLEIPRPAMLKDLLGEFIVTVLSCDACESDAIGVK